MQPESPTPRFNDDWLDAFLKYTENTEPPFIWRTWTGIATISAALGRKCWTYVGRYFQYPGMYIVFVGPAASGKGTAMVTGEKLLEAAKIQRCANAVPGKGLLLEIDKGKKPVMLSGKNTMTFSHTTAFCQEFSSFVGAGGETQQDLFIASLIQLYDGMLDEYKDNALSRKEIKLVRPGLTLLGVTTRKHLRDHLPSVAIGGGFSSRVIFTYSGNVPLERRVLPFNTVVTQEQESIWATLVHDLDRIKTIRGEFVWEGGPGGPSVELYHSWVEKRITNPPKMPSEFEAYLERSWKTHIPRLSMIYSANRGDDLVIRPEDVSLAIATLETTEKTMPPVFASYSAKDDLEIMQSIMRTVKLRKVLHRGTLYNEHIHDCPSWQKFVQIVEGMRQMNPPFVTMERVGTVDDYIIRYNEARRKRA